MSTELDDIDHLPNSYTVGSSMIPSNFKLDDHKREKLNPLMEYAEAAAIEDAPSTSGSTKEDLQLESDFNLVRSNIKASLEATNSVLTDAIGLAQSSDSPRAYEVVSTLLKAIADTNLDLLNIHEKRETIKSKRFVKSDTAIQNNQQNNYFVGSPAELNKLLNDASVTK